MATQAVDMASVVGVVAGYVAGLGPIMAGIIAARVSGTLLRRVYVALVRSV